jgi:hypothetical protein
MKNTLWRLSTVVVVLTMLVLGLAMLLAGCGPEEETPTPVPVKPTSTPVPTVPPTDTPVLSEAEGPLPLPAETEAGGLIDDFEGGAFDDRWWSYEEGSRALTCTSDQPGHTSAQAMRLTFEVGADGYAGCGMDVDPGRWGEAGGLSFFWRADQPGLMMIVALGMEDPT